ERRDRGGSRRSVVGRRRDRASARGAGGAPPRARRAREGVHVGPLRGDGGDDLEGDRVSPSAPRAEGGRAAPRVLVLGTLFGQPMGGVRRHNAELLPRAAKLLEERGGSLAVLEGREPAAFDLPPPIERIASDAAPHPVLAR